MESPESSDGSWALWEQDSFAVEEKSSSNSNSFNADQHLCTSQESPIKHELLSGLSQFREMGMFCDVVLKVGNTEIPAHKIVLCACSPYFSAMFSGQFKERNQQVVILENLDPDMLNIVIDYIYTGNLAVTTENVRPVLLVVNFLQINSAQEICCRVMSKEITRSNCLEYMEFAGKHSLKSLLRAATECAAKEVCHIYWRSEFLNLDFMEINTILEDNGLKKYPDDIVLCVIHKWVDHSPETRKSFFPALLKHISSARVTKELVEASPYVKNNADCDKWFKEADKFVPDDWILYVFNRLGNHIMQRISPKKKELTINLKRIPEDVCQSSYTAYGSSIFVQGGWTSADGFTTKTFCYNAYRDNWTSFVPLTVARANHRGCALNNRLYTMGGAKNLETMNLVECLDLLTGQYISCKNLNRERSSFGATVFDNCIYIMGGSDLVNYINTVERYDPRVGEWEVLPATMYSKGHCSSTVFNNQIYCTIGPGGAMERFDVRNNQWTLIENFDEIYPREIFSAGDDLYGTLRNRICKYNSNGKWGKFKRPHSSTDWLTMVPLKIVADLL